MIKQIRKADRSASQWLAMAKGLAWFTILYNLVEGLVSMGFGAADDSLALFGFGADSFIEVGSAIMILWRLKSSGCETTGLKRERKATQGIALLLILLAIFTSLGALWRLWKHQQPGTTLPGVIISLASLSFMYWLWRSKKQCAAALNSRALASDAACSLACMQLSVVLLLGSLAFMLVPALWWIDSAAALGIAAFILKEGWGSLRAARHPDFSGGCGCH